MALTFGQVETAARDYSPWFDRSRVPQGVAARMCSDIQRDLVSKLARANPNAIATSQTVSLAFGSAISLNAHELVVRAQANFTDTTLDPAPITFLTPGMESMTWATYLAYLEGGSLYLVGDASDWTAITNITVWYIAAATDITTEATTLALPDNAKEALAKRLAAEMALRASGHLGAPGLDVEGYRMAALAAESAFLARQAQQRVTRTLVNLTDL